MEYLTDNFRRFFKNLNVRPAVEQIASREYAGVKELLEARHVQTAELSPRCFLQGSYKQETAIHDLNDIDIVALCELWQPGSGTASGTRIWTRDAIFEAMAAVLRSDARYRNGLRYNAESMCIKLDLDIKVEILPVVYKSGNNDPLAEPFRLYRPSSRQWEDGFARYHQQWLSWKNAPDQTGGTFIPAIKVLKHLRTIFNKPAISFHIECLLFRLPHSVFFGAPAEYIPRVLSTIASRTAESWYATVVRTPCEDRDI
jgi:hypothetical protein